MAVQYDERYNDQIFLRGELQENSNFIIAASLSRDSINKYYNPLSPLKNNGLKGSSSTDNKPVWFVLSSNQTEIFWDLSSNMKPDTYKYKKSTTSVNKFNFTRGKDINEDSSERKEYFLYFDEEKNHAYLNDTIQSDFSLFTEFNVENDRIYTGIPYYIESLNKKPIYWNFSSASEKDIDRPNPDIRGCLYNNTGSYFKITNVSSRDLKLKIYFLPSIENIYYYSPVKSMDEILSGSDLNGNIILQNINKKIDTGVPINVPSDEDVKNAVNENYFNYLLNGKYLYSLGGQNDPDIEEKKINYENNMEIVEYIFREYYNIQNLLKIYIQNTDILFEPISGNKTLLSQGKFIFFSEKELAQEAVFFNYCLDSNTCGDCFGIVKEGDTSPCKAINYDPNLDKEIAEEKAKEKAAAIKASKIKNTNEKIKKYSLYGGLGVLSCFFIILLIYYFKKK